MNCTERQPRFWPLILALSSLEALSCLLVVCHIPSQSFSGNIWSLEPSLCTKIVQSWQIPKLSWAALLARLPLALLLNMGYGNPMNLSSSWTSLQAPWSPCSLNSFRLSPPTSAFLSTLLRKGGNLPVDDHPLSLISAPWTYEHKY